MLKKENFKKLIVCLITISLLILTIKTTFATNASIDEFENEFHETVGNNDAVDNIPQGNRTTNELDNNLTNKSLENNQANQLNQPENAPTENAKAGLGDNSSIIFIVIFAISAIYACKKVRDYNI